MLLLHSQFLLFLQSFLLEMDLLNLVLLLIYIIQLLYLSTSWRAFVMVVVFMIVIPFSGLIAWVISLALYWGLRPIIILL
jgi:hypothetical protein